MKSDMGHRACFSAEGSPRSVERSHTILQQQALELCTGCRSPIASETQYG